MKTLYPVCFATVYGLILRIVYGFLGDIVSIMGIGFLILAPVAIGFLTVFLWPKKYYLTPIAAFFVPSITSLVILLITILIEVEGAICWVMIFPFFAVAAGVGGLIARRYRKYVPEKAEFDFEKDETLKVSFVLFIPLFAGLIEGNRTSNRDDYTISRSIVIETPVSNVWHELTHINDISAKEKKYSLATMLGFPKHLQTTLDSLCVGGKRKAVYEKGLYFDETIASFEKEKSLVLNIKTAPDKIPPTVMDEHVLIGGEHIDILQDKYILEPLSANSCRITLSSHFYINTPINWYAGIWARYMMKDMLQDEIELIKDRSIRDAGLHNATRN
ncbi:MAG: hypothetical protein QM802_19190 [Agriterribacter sp.]